MDIRRCFMVLAGLMLAGGVFAQGEGGFSRFEKTLSLGATLTDGNSETMLYNGSLLLEGEQESLGVVKVGIEGSYGENKVRENVDGVETRRKDTTVENVKAFANARKTLSDMTYAYIDANYLYDDIAEVDYRVTVGPGFGMYLLKDEAIELSAEAGVSYLWEKVSDVSDDYPTLRLAETFSYRFAENSKVWQSLVYMPEWGEFQNYLVVGEIGAEAPLNGKVNLRIVLQDTYDSTPGKDLKRNDLTLIAGIGIKL